MSYPLDATKITQQLTPSLCANTRDILQDRDTPCLVSTQAMARYGKTMRFIPNLLDKMKCHGVAWQMPRCMRETMQGFKTWLTARPFGHANQGYFLKLQCHHDIIRCLKLRQSTID